MEEEGTTYYYIKSKKLFAKSTSSGDYIYKNGEWSKDTKHLVCDRLLGYDPSDDSPYGIGNTDIMEDLEKITEEEFKKNLMSNQNKVL